MVHRELLDPELAPLLPFLPDLDFDGRGLVTVRASLAEMEAMQPPVDALTVTVTEHAIAGADGNAALPVTTYTPAASAATSRAAIVHFHSGGFVVGRASMDRFANATLAAELDCVIVSVDYRLAPEAPHPAQRDDAVLALDWVVREAATLGIDLARIGLKGESAGGGLATALALHARDRGGPPLAFLHLTYPMLDDRTTERDDHPHVGGHVWTAAHNRFAWRAFLGKGQADASAAPARASDLAGLPPTYIAVGALDLFADEDIVFARRLVDAGVPTEFHLYPGAFHGFDLAPEAAVAIAARRDGIVALRRMLG